MGFDDIGGINEETGSSGKIVLAVKSFYLSLINAKYWIIICRFDVIIQTSRVGDVYDTIPLNSPPSSGNSFEFKEDRLPSSVGLSFLIT